LIVTKIPSEQIFIYADGRQLYRSIENLYTNAAKYALENTRVYVELEKADKKAVFTIKNVNFCNYCQISRLKSLIEFTSGLV